MPSFNGDSYLAHPLPPALHDMFTIDLTLLTIQPDGLILFSAKSDSGTGDYVSLGLETGVVIFRYNLGSGHFSLSSNVRIDDGLWHTISISRDQRLSYLIVDGVLQMNGSSSGALDQLNLFSPLFVGGVNSFNLLQDEVSQTGGFVGCIRDFQINSQSVGIVLDAQYGFNIAQCPEPVCSYVECQNGAMCVETSSSNGFMCECADGFSGQFCEAPGPLCVPNPCQFGGMCSQFGNTFSCLCPLGRGGRTCEQGKFMFLSV